MSRNVHAPIKRSILLIPEQDQKPDVDEAFLIQLRFRGSRTARRQLCPHIIFGVGYVVPNVNHHVKLGRIMQTQFDERGSRGFVFFCFFFGSLLFFIGFFLVSFFFHLPFLYRLFPCPFSLSLTTKSAERTSTLDPGLAGKLNSEVFSAYIVGSNVRTQLPAVMMQALTFIALLLSLLVKSKWSKLSEELYPLSLTVNALQALPLQDACAICGAAPNTSVAASMNASLRVIAICPLFE